MDIRHNEAERRFETLTGAGLAVLQYRLNGTTLALTHTGVPVEAEGRGTGTALVRFALDYAREHRFLVDPLCPFVAAHIQRNPEDRELVLPSSLHRLS